MVIGCFCGFVIEAYILASGLVAIGGSILGTNIYNRRCRRKNCQCDCHNGGE